MQDQNRQYRVLFVDDEPRVTNALKAMFRRDYEVYTANSGDAALALLADTRIDVLVSDQRMPGMLGSELLASVSQRYPRTMRILLTGFMDKKAIVDSINHGEVYRFINKPWRKEAMQHVLSEAAQASDLPVDLYASKKAADDTRGDASTRANTTESRLGRALLMIEQDQTVRHQIRRFCAQHQIQIYGTQNPQQALAAATSRQNIGVALIELSSDTTAAIQTINLLRQARPELIAIVLTEEYDANTAVDLINQGQVFRYLAKPIEATGLHSALKNAFRRHAFLRENTSSTNRYRVEKPVGLSASLQAWINRIVQPKLQK
ncbi:two-component system response regulator [Arenicella chitinivorans]|uniref:Two-component system response regulator n=1 Tax=Arenicella chitinivorans TaxID=1329800 RepID=A0A918S4P1_9GAMM|nr:response regulator [Arenicella chitinivorans]GHA20241.1 two-component system response regulator [Arenicella chitinivorans]